MSILGTLSAFNQGQNVELFELDLTPFGAELLRFHGGVNEYMQPIIWQGNEYTPFPVEATGFAKSSTGTVPRPSLKIANINGAVSQILMATGDIEGARFVRKRTKVMYLDAVNFLAGNPTADPLSCLPDDVFYISQKKSENIRMIEFELAPSTDLQGVMIPNRQINASYCPFTYRSEECGYTGGACATENDIATTDIAIDQCSKKLSGCKMRFGANGELPFGGFPSSSLVRFT